MSTGGLTGTYPQQVLPLGCKLGYIPEPPAEVRVCLLNVVCNESDPPPHACNWDLVLFREVLWMMSNNRVYTKMSMMSTRKYGLGWVGQSPSPTSQNQIYCWLASRGGVRVDWLKPSLSSKPCRNAGSQDPPPLHWLSGGIPRTPAWVSGPTQTKIPWYGALSRGV